MKTHLLTLVLLFALPFALAAQKPIKKSVYFDTDQDSLTAEAQKTLSGLLRELAKWPDFDIHLEAYTDERGTTEYNRALAERRAGAVHAYLTAAGCKPRRVDVRSLGETTEQRGATATESRRLNRRVDITVLTDGIDDFKELFSKVATRAAETFTIENQRATKTEWTAANGVRLSIPAGSFITADGKAPKGPVEITFQSADNPSDWLLNNLSTMTNEGDLLQTAGMFYVSASAEGKPLLIKGGKSIEISVPVSGQIDPEMEIFYGARAGKNDPPVTWRRAETTRQDADPTRSPSFMELLKQRRYTLLDSLKEMFRSVQLPVAQRPILPKFDDQLLRYGRRGMPRAPRMNQPLKPEEPELFVDAGADDKEERAAREKYRAERKLYKKRLARYEDRLERYKARWEKYRRDSTNYELAREYFAEARKTVERLEDSMLIYCLHKAFNERVAGHWQFRGNYMFYKGLKELPEEAFWDGVTAANKKIHQGLRKKTKLPALYYYCDEGSFINSLWNNRTCVNDSLRDIWTERCRLRLADLAESSGYNAIYRQIEEQHDQVLDGLQQELSANVGMLTDYTFEVTQMGWINIDKFYKYPESERRPLAIEEPDNDTRFYVYCKGVNGLLSLQYQRGKFVSPPLPNDLEIAIIGIKLKNGMPQLFRQERRVGDGSEIIRQPAYRDVTLRELEVEMRKLNG